MMVMINKYRISRIYIGNLADAIRIIQQRLDEIVNLKSELANAHKEGKPEIKKDALRIALREARKSLKWQTNYARAFVNGKFHSPEKTVQEEKLIPKEDLSPSYWHCTRCGHPKYCHSGHDSAPACSECNLRCPSFSKNQKLAYGKLDCKHREIALMGGKVFCKNNNCYADITDTEIGRKRIANEPMIRAHFKEAFPEEEEHMHDVQVTINEDTDTVVIEVLGDSKESGRIEIANYSQLGARDE